MPQNGCSTTSYLAHQAVREIREDMPRGFYGQLPLLADGPLAGLPPHLRHQPAAGFAGAARLDLDYAASSSSSTRMAAPLDKGDLWALPAMLRLSLDRARPHAARDHGPARCRRRCPRSRCPARQPPTSLSATASSACVRSRRTTGAASSRRSAGSRRSCAGTRPGSTRDGPGRRRDQYRKAVEDLAASAGRDEQAVAAEAVALARRGAGPPDADASAVPPPDWLAPPQAHAGYYLIDAGVRQLKLAVGYRAGLRDRLSDAARRHPTPLYLGPIWLLAALLLLAGLAVGPGVGRKRGAAGPDPRARHRARADRRGERRGLAGDFASVAPRACPSLTSTKASPILSGRWWSCPRCSGRQPM